MTAAPEGSSPPLLGLMLGDCTGIGPEQCARILADGRLAAVARLLVVGDVWVLQAGARDACVTLAARSWPTPEDVDWSRGEAPVIDLGNADPGGCRGLFPADTVFLKAFAGEYDGVLTMYHDQARSRPSSRGSIAGSR